MALRLSSPQTPSAAQTGSSCISWLWNTLINGLMTKEGLTMRVTRMNAVR